MKLIKDGEIINLPNKNHADAFIASGWSKYKGEEKQITSPPSTKRTKVAKK